MNFAEKVRELKLKEILQHLDSDYNELVEEEYFWIVKEPVDDGSPAQQGVSK